MALDQGPMRSGDGGGGGDGGDVFFSSEVMNIWKIGWEKYDVD